MAINDILNTIRNSKFDKDKNNKFGHSESSKIFCIFDNKEAYGIWIVKYEKYENICVCKIAPTMNSGLSIDQLPKNINSMKAMWLADIKQKYDTIENAMKSI